MPGTMLDLHTTGQAGERYSSSPIDPSVAFSLEEDGQSVVLLQKKSGAFPGGR